MKGKMTLVKVRTIVMFSAKIGLNRNIFWDKKLEK